MTYRLGIRTHIIDNFQDIRHSKVMYKCVYFSVKDSWVREDSEWTFYRIYEFILPFGRW